MYKIFFFIETVSERQMTHLRKSHLIDSLKRLLRSIRTTKMPSNHFVKSQKMSIFSHVNMYLLFVDLTWPKLTLPNFRRSDQPRIFWSKTFDKEMNHLFFYLRVSSKWSTTYFSLNFMVFDEVIFLKKWVKIPIQKYPIHLLNGIIVV